MTQAVTHTLLGAFATAYSFLVYFKSNAKFQKKNKKIFAL